VLRTSIDVQVRQETCHGNNHFRLKTFANKLKILSPPIFDIAGLRKLLERTARERKENNGYEDRKGSKTFHSIGIRKLFSAETAA
jgi:hypothetical protein